MATQAKVTSLDALESFRASLILFLTAARRSTDEVRDQVRRTRLWLQNDQRLHWEHEVRRWTKLLEQAKAELMGAKLSTLRDTSSAQQAAVLKAKRALTEAEEKLKAVKRWNRDFESAADPLVKRMEGLRDFLDQEMPKAITHLVQVLRTLESYTLPVQADAPSSATEGNDAG